MGKRLFRGWVGVVLSLCLINCSESRAVSSPPAPAPTKERVIPMVGSKGTGNPSPPSPPSETKTISLDPLFGVPAQRFFPEDFDLGPLQPPSNPEAKESIQVVEELFKRLKEGYPVKELLHPKYRWFLEQELDSRKGKTLPFREVRVGTLLEGSDATREVPVRILLEGGSVRGSVLLEKEEKWLIADVSLDWERLEAVSTPGGGSSREKFDPFSYTRY